MTCQEQKNNYLKVSHPVEKDFREECDHGHHLRCYICEDLKDVMNDIKHQILESSASMYTKEYQEDLVYDLEQARTDILQWKAHILRLVNQDKAKQDIISNLNDSCLGGNGLGDEILANEVQGEAVRLVC